ncbi:MAG TPA: hypothetical protein VH333_26605 [Pseudonocardiaceae bacterium]|jgi:hypothetical protein|nr:hypothetical protein [Pseudonocardiaceae bacterium]
MSSLNVLTWNSTGETAQGAADLAGVINYLIQRENWQPQVIVIQEANANPGGAIYNMLASLGGAYNQPPGHAVEGGAYGRGYLLLTHRSVQVTVPFVRANLDQDPVLLNVINGLPPAWRTTALNELTGMRMPAVAGLVVGGAAVPFLTWHAPRGPGPLLGTALPGGANADAFWFLQNSSVYQQLTAPGRNNVGVIAGDLNITYAAINAPTNIPALPEILPDFDGVSDNLDHIVAHPQPGQAAPTFPGATTGHFPASGTHNILVSTIVW